jgi:hypothetical protein
MLRHLTTCELNLNVCLQAKRFWESGIITDIRNYYTFFATVALLVFPAIGFAIEKFATIKQVPKAIVSGSSKFGRQCLNTCF